MSAHMKSKHNNNQSFMTVGSYRFKQSDLLGSGYESQVYKATHITKKFEVAIKIIDLQKIGQGIHSRLLDSQLRCLQTLKKTPYVINLLDIVKTEKQIYVITQICQGDLGRRKQMITSEEKAWEYMKQLIKGYKYIFEKGIIHRDLKPQNMFMKSGGQVKIGDFGFATTFQQAKQQSHYNIGSPSYMAPEVLSRNDYSHASDIWSIGVSYYQLVTGNVPWQGQCEAQIRSQITRDSIDDVIQSAPISEASKQFLRKLLQYSPYDRIKPEELFEYQINFTQLRNKHIAEKYNDKYSVTTAETPKYAKNKPKGFMTPRNNSTKFDFDQLADDIFNQSVQPTQSSRQLKIQNEKHSRRMSFDGNLQTSKKHLEVPLASKQLIVNSQRNVGDSLMNFKKKHRTSFDVGSSKQMSNQLINNCQFSLDRVIDGYIKLCDTIFQFLRQTSQVQHNKQWRIQFNMFRICMKNYLIKTLSKIENLQNSDLLRQIASEQQIRIFCGEQQFKNAYNLVKKNKQIYLLNQEIQKHSKIARQQRLKNLVNSGLSLLSVLKKQVQTQPTQNILMISDLVCYQVEVYMILSKKNYLTLEDILNVKKTRKSALKGQHILQRINSLKK